MRRLIVLVAWLACSTPSIAQAPMPTGPSVGPAVAYVPTPPEVVTEMLRVAEVKPGDLVYDLGSGDGRIVIAAVREFGARGVGIEQNARLLAESAAAARTAGVGDRVRFVNADLFAADFSEAAIVTLYLLPEVNRRLRPRLFEQLKPGTLVVSNSFDMGEWQPDRKSRVLTSSRGEVYVYAWIVPANVSGTWQANAPEGPGPYTLKLEQVFQRVRGTLTARAQTRTLTDIRLTGDTLRFSVVLPERSVAVRFEARLSGERLEGTATAPGSFARAWQATRTERSTAPWYF